METLPPHDRAPAPARRRLPRGVWWAIALAIVVLAVAGLKATSSDRSDAGAPTVLDPTATQPPPCNPLLDCGPDAVGAPISTATFDRFDGTQASFADYAGQPLVINFWSSSCVPCVTEMPALEAVHQDYAGRVRFVGVDVQDGIDPARTMADRTGVTYDLVRDPDGSLIASVGGNGLPTTVLVRADGTIARVSGPGAIDPDDLRRSIDQDLLS
jgi:thiol-disulfide isomerase/thioredoxin